MPRTENWEGKEMTRWDAQDVTAPHILLGIFRGEFKTANFIYHAIIYYLSQMPIFQPWYVIFGQVTHDLTF